jgi:hypothetical protein
MRAQHWGRVVLLSSGAADGAPGLEHYAAAKAALHGISRSLATGAGPDGILSNIVMPGLVATAGHRRTIPAAALQQWADRTPTRRLATEQDVAAVVVVPRLGRERQHHRRRDPRRRRPARLSQPSAGTVPTRAPVELPLTGQPQPLPARPTHRTHYESAEHGHPPHRPRHPPWHGQHLCRRDRADNHDVGSLGRASGPALRPPKSIP